MFCTGTNHQQTPTSECPAGYGNEESESERSPRRKLILRKAVFAAHTRAARRYWYWSRTRLRCHKPMADIYDAARVVRGAVAKSSTSTFGNNDCPRPKAIMENDILFIAIANCDNICRFDNITPASRCRLMAAAIACSWSNLSTQNVGEQSSSRADSGAPTSSRNRG